MNYLKLEKIARDIRISVLKNIRKAGFGHLGGSYSCVEILVSLYYDNVLNIKKNNLSDKARNQFLLGKGHACLTLYPILRDLEIISNEMYESYGSYGNAIGGQLDIRIPSISINTGSLGHVVGIAAGIAYAARLDNRTTTAYCLIGDAECDEGSIFESLMFASKHKLNNLVVIIDRNRMSVTDSLDNDHFFNDFQNKMISFGINGLEVDGHDFNQLKYAFNEASKAYAPSVILANTIKAKGVSFMENIATWHHGVPSYEQYESALKELLDERV